MSMMKVKVHADAMAEDIPGMREMPESGYENWIDGELFFVDHHDILRAVHGDYPIATTSTQMRILIDYLNGVADRMREAGH